MDDAFNALAARMYPNMAGSGEVALPASSDAAGKDLAADTRTFEDVAENIYSLTPGEVVSTYKPALQDNLDQLRDLTGMDDAQANAHLTTVANVFHDAGIPSHEAASIHSLVVQHAATPADDTMVEQWAVEARREMRARYGSDADRRLAKAKAFLAERPDFARSLTESGLGSHPRVVLALAERADELRTRPRKGGKSP